MSITARVRLEVDILVGTWEDSESLSSLRNVARREGVQIAKRLLEGDDKRHVVLPGARVVLIVFDEMKGGDA